VKIPLISIHIGKRFREIKDIDVRDLVEDFRNPEIGQLTPITVRPSTPEEQELGLPPYVLIAGGRRIKAAFVAGWSEIEAFDRGQTSELYSRIGELHENLKRVAFNWQEEVTLKAEIKQLMQLANPELVDAEIAAKLGVSKATLSKDLATHKAIIENPSLAKASTKKAALGASKLLAESNQRIKRIQAQEAERPQFVGDIEDKIVTAEAEDFVVRLGERVVDLFLCDGPYGYGYWKVGQKHEAGDTALSNYDDDPAAAGEMYRRLIPRVVRAARQTGWLMFFCGRETFDLLDDLLTDCCAEHASYRHNIYPVQCEVAVGLPAQMVGKCRFLRPEIKPWIWYKPNARNNPRYKELHEKDMYELIHVTNLGKGRLLRPMRGNVLVHEAPYGEGRIHANQKPISLGKDLIERVTFPGDLVVDLFHGAGEWSVGAAAALQRDFRACDSNPTMRQFALASAVKHYQPLSPAALRESHERYRRGLERTTDGLDDYSEEGEADRRVQEAKAALDMQLFLKRKREQDEMLAQHMQRSPEEAAREAAARRRQEEELV
jgi:ParB-like chromosome segregation protein Spo0J